MASGGKVPETNTGAVGAVVGVTSDLRLHHHINGGVGVGNLGRRRASGPGRCRRQGDRGRAGECQDPFSHHSVPPQGWLAGMANFDG